MFLFLRDELSKTTYWGTSDVLQLFRPTLDTSIVKGGKQDGVSGLLPQQNLLKILRVQSWATWKLLIPICTWVLQMNQPRRFHRLQVNLCMSWLPRSRNRLSQGEVRARPQQKCHRSTQNKRKCKLPVSVLED